MSLVSKTYYLNYTNVIIEANNISWNWHRGNYMYVNWNFRKDNYDFYEGVLNKGDGTINGDLIYVLPDPSADSIGDIIVSVGWTGGFAVRKVQTAGSMSILFHDATPLGALTTYNSIGVDRDRYQAYVGQYATAGLAKIDFSNTSSISVLETITTAGHGISHDSPGYPYFNGLAVAGDWLYLGHYDIGDYNYTTKWNTQDSSSDDLLAWNRITDMRYGHIRYYPEEDWIVSQWLRDGDAVMIISASFASSSVTGNQAICLRTTDLGITNDHYSTGTVLMKTGSNYVRGDKHHLVVSGFLGTRFLYCDAGLMITGSNEQPIGANVLSLRNVHGQGNRAEQRYLPGGREAQYSTIQEHPTLKDKLIFVCADRSYMSGMGWLDLVNMVQVGDPYINSVGYGSGKMKSGGGGTVVTYHSEGNRFNAAYGGQCVLVTGEDGDEYYVYSEYTTDGFRAYARSKWPDGMGLCATASITFGEFTLPENVDIGAIYIGNSMLDLYTASGANLYMKVSNNGGVSWENYEYLDDAYHDFSSTGNTGRLKLEFTGSISQSAHYYGNNYLFTSIVQKDPIPDKTKIKGYSTFNISGV